jgi:hypothetical protein
MPSARDEAQSVSAPEAFRRRIEIADGEHDVVDPKHGAR